MLNKKSDGAGSPVTETMTIWCCQCTPCEIQLMLSNESPDEHECVACVACEDRLQEIAAPMRKRIRIENHIDMQQDKIKRYESLASRLDISQALQREKKILCRLTEKLAELDEKASV